MDGADQRKRLELLVLPPAPPAPSGRDDVLADVPLLHVKWSVVPGVVQVLLVSDPSVVHMFQQVDALAKASGTAPRFGHLERRADDDLRGCGHLARPRSFGVLMQIRQIARLPDGRLSVVACAICRFKVLRPTALSPYPRADVLLTPDDEEIAATGLRSAAHAQLSADERAEAARAAAAAAALTWSSAEVGELMPSVVELEGAAATDGGTTKQLEGLAPFNVRLSLSGTSSAAKCPPLSKSFQ